MKRRQTIIIIFALVLAAGCLTDGVDKTPTSFSISGRIIDQQFYGIDKATVYLTGETADGVSVTRQVDTNTMGSFSFASMKNGTYTLSPAKISFGFYPSTRTVTVNGSNTAVEIFTGYATTDGGSEKEGYIVSGQVLDVYGKGVADVTVAISGGDVGRVTKTDTKGDYRFTKVVNGAYLIVPSDQRYRFEPSYSSIFVRGYGYVVDPFTAFPDDNGPDIIDDGVGTHAYFPLANGTSRSMKVIENDYLASDFREYNRPLTARGTKDYHGKTYRVIEDGTVRITRFRVDGETVYTFAHDIQGLTFSDTNLGGETGESTPFTEEIPYLVFGIAVGETYTILDYSTQNYGGYFVWKWTGTYLGVETVTAIAGTFENCRKYSLFLDSYAVSGSATARDLTQIIIWLAPSVGPVRIEEKRSSGSRITYEKSEECIGYSIP